MIKNCINEYIQIEIRIFKFFRCIIYVASHLYFSISWSGASFPLGMDFPLLNDEATVIDIFDQHNNNQLTKGFQDNAKIKSN